jgi:hypothetical protein
MKHSDAYDPDPDFFADAIIVPNPTRAQMRRRRNTVRAIYWSLLFGWCAALAAAFVFPQTAGMAIYYVATLMNVTP